MINSPLASTALRLGLVASASATLLFGPAGLTTYDSAQASSHREAPMISQDPAADNTDLYAFVSPDKPSTVTLIANWWPMCEPAGGPNFCRFDDNVLTGFRWTAGPMR